MMHFFETLKTQWRGVPTHIFFIADSILGIAFILAFIFVIFFPQGQRGLFRQDRSGWRADDPRIISEARRVKERCSKNGGLECYKKELSFRVAKHGFSYGEQALYALQDIDPATKSCHTIAHFMAREAVRRNPSDWALLVDTINVQACGSGFLHGVLEAHVANNPGLEINSDFADEICTRGNDAYRQRMCAHFMGHVFLLEREGDVVKALPQCGGVTPRLQFDCYDGLFMEDHQKLALVEHGFSSDPILGDAYVERMEKNCLKYQGQLSDACWTEMAEMYAKTYGYEPKVIYDRCYNHAPTDSARQSCYFKGIVVVGTYPLEPSSKKLLGICAPYEYEKNQGQYQSCASALFAALFYYSPKFVSRGINFCARVPQSLREWCFGELGRQLAQFVASPTERTALCQETPEPYKKMCSNT